MCFLHAWQISLYKISVSPYLSGILTSWLKKQKLPSEKDRLGSVESMHWRVSEFLALRNFKSNPSTNHFASSTTVNPTPPPPRPWLTHRLNKHFSLFSCLCILCSLQGMCTSESFLSALEGMKGPDLNPVLFRWGNWGPQRASVLPEGFHIMSWRAKNRTLLLLPPYCAACYPVGFKENLHFLNRESGLFICQFTECFPCGGPSLCIM